MIDRPFQLRSDERSAVCFALAVPLVAVTLLSKFSVPPLGARGIGLSLFAIYAALALGALRGWLHYEPRRLALLCLTIALLGLPQLLRADPFSFESMLLLCALHVPYVFVLDDGARWAPLALRYLSAIGVILACCAVAQFALQPIIDARWLFPIDNLVPDALQVQQFNPQAPVRYGVELYRANGVFMLEPSYLTQFLAVAFVAEVCTRARWTRLALFAFAILVAYSGTGLMILGLCLPLVIVKYRRWDLLLASIVGLALLWAFGDVLRLDLVASRAGELASTGSSGFARFVGGFYMFEQFLWHEPWRALVGYGAGTFRDYATLAEYPVAEMPLFKMIFEFGLLGGALYFGFLFYCLAHGAVSRIVALSVGLTFLLNGLYVPFSHGLALSLLVLTSAHRAAPAETPRPTRFDLTHAPLRAV